MNAQTLTMTAAEVARNFNRVLDSLEYDGSEVEIMRNRRPVARIVPGVKHMTALEALTGLHATLADEEAREWVKDMASFDRPLAEELKDPWE